MGTRGYEYNQIRVCMHILMGSQISVYYTRGYPFSYPSRACDGFYPQVPMGMSIFATPDSKESAASTTSSMGLAMKRTNSNKVRDLNRQLIRELWFMNQRS